MLIALGVSLVFTFTYATWAAKSPRAGTLLIPLLDILQSVPILGFISITVVFFLSLAPGRMFGAEIAAVFAIFTEPGLEHGVQLLPVAAHGAGGTGRSRPHVRPQRLGALLAHRSAVRHAAADLEHDDVDVRRLVLRASSEAISVGHTTIALPGIGSYIARPSRQKNLTAIFWAIGAMLVVILIYDQLLFRPLVAWADRFRFDSEAARTRPTFMGADVMSALAADGAWPSAFRR